MAYTDPNIGVTGDHANGLDGWDTEYNNNMMILRVLAHEAILNIVTSPAGGEVDGNLYAVGAGATGAFVGQDGKLAYFKTSAWVFVTPPVGKAMWNLTGGVQVRYLAGAWA